MKNKERVITKRVELFLILGLSQFWYLLMYFPENFESYSLSILIGDLLVSILIAITIILPTTRWVFKSSIK